MTTTNKNFNYYFNIFATPSYKMRKTLEEDYRIMTLGPCSTIGFLSMVADHLTAYNELAACPVFFRINSFRLDN